MRVSHCIAHLLIVCSFAVHAEPLTIAVASNFRSAAEELAGVYSETTGEDWRISSASTSKLYSQIRSGAPFDVFLAADSKHPQLLEQAGIAIEGSRRSYAIGGLVLWSRDSSLASGDCRAALDRLGKRRLAIANPRTAPYGNAARQFLVTAGLWERVEPRLVYGESIGQAMQFAATGNAQLGIVAASQVGNPDLPKATCAWKVPAELHEPIEQQLVLLSNKKAALAFADFLGGEKARAILQDFGYGVPE